MKFFWVRFLAAAAALTLACGPTEDEAARGVAGQPATEPTYPRTVDETLVEVTVLVERQPDRVERTPPSTTEPGTPRVIREKVEVIRVGPGATVLPTATPGPLQVTRTEFRLAMDGGVIGEILRFLPDRPDARIDVGVDDLVPMWESNADLGVPRPGPEAPADWIKGYIEQVGQRGGHGLPYMAAAPFICCPRGYLQSFAPYPYTGFDIRNVNQALRAGEREEYEVVIGDYDSNAFTEQIRGCGECVPPDQSETYAGLIYLSWGEDFTGNLRQRFAPPLFDHVGRGGRLAIGDGFALRALSTDAMTGMIDAWTGRVPSLADNPDYELAARALNALGSYAAAFRSGGMAIGEVGTDSRYSILGFESVEAQKEAVGIGMLLKPFTLAAAGLVTPALAGDVIGAIVLVHASEADARANADLLPKRMRLRWDNEAPYWGNHWWDAVERIEVSVDGRVLLARLHAGPDAKFQIVPWSILYPGPVLVHE